MFSSPVFWTNWSHVIVYCVQLDVSVTLRVFIETLHPRGAAVTIGHFGNWA
jgi:hypothetical protein